MRWQIATLGVLVCSAALCAAQSGAVGLRPAERDTATAALEHGKLVIWIVHQAERKWKPDEPAAQSPISLPKTVQEATAGSFGQTSSELGQTAGSYGQTAGSLGKAASDVGTASSNVGQGPGSFGRAASDVGQTASSYGQTAGSYGESLSTIGQAVDPHPTSSRTSVKHSAQWDRVVMQLRGDFRGLEVSLKDVHEEDLSSELKHTAGSPDAPDVLLGSPLPWTWTRAEGGKAAQRILANMGTQWYPVQVEDTAPGNHTYAWVPDVAIVANTPHADRAQAFAVWVSDGGICRACGSELPPNAVAPASVAVSALKGVLAGGGVDGHADIEMAKSNGDLVRGFALQVGRGLTLDGLTANVDVVKAEANDRLAMVELRTTVSVAQAFGVLHSLVVLRKDTAGKWKVLQLTPNLSAGLLHEAAGILTEFCVSANPTKVLGISQASPTEGEVRGMRPDLWWDNSGGATVQIVEWQQGYGERWTGTRLYFVPDRDPHLRTRVTADFATNLATYRWRVWSMGRGGVVVLSPWRTMKIDH